MRTEATLSAALVVGFPRANITVGEDRFDALPGAICEARAVSRALGCSALVRQYSDTADEGYSAGSARVVVT